MHPTATTFHLESVDDVERAVRLLQLPYLVHVAVLQRSGEAESGSIEMDVRGELDELEPSGGIRDAFEDAIAPSDWCHRIIGR